MNNLILTKKRLKKAARLHDAQLETFKKGVFTSYSPLVFKERKKKANKEIVETDF